MSKTKRLYMPEIYEEIDGIKACDHANFDEYFEKCTDCDLSIDDMPEAIREAYYEQFEVTPQERLMEQAEIYRDQMREDGINV